MHHKYDMHLLSLLISIRFLEHISLCHYCGWSSQRGRSSGQQFLNVADDIEITWDTFTGWQFVEKRLIRPSLMYGQSVPHNVPSTVNLARDICQSGVTIFPLK